MSLAWRFYLRLYKGSSHAIAFAVGLSLIQVALTLPIALLLSRLFNSALSPSDFWKIAAAAVALIALYMLGDVALLGAARISLRVTKDVILSLREQLAAAVYRMPLHIGPQYETGWLHTALVHDTERVDVMSNSLLSRVIPSVLSVVGILLILAGLSWQLFGFSLLVLPVSWATARLFHRPVHRRIERFHREFEGFSTTTIAVLQRRDLALVQGAEQIELDRLSHHSRAIREAGHQVAWITIASGIAQGEAAFATGILVLLAGLALIASGHMTIGTLFAFYFALGFVRSNLTVLFGQVPALVAGHLALGRLYELAQTKHAESYRGEQPIVFRGTVALANVGFGYEEPLLHNATMTLRPGETTALMGDSGVGKTTLANLILGLVKPQSGQLSADGRSYEEIDLNMLRARIGYAHQSPVTFAGTVRDNLSFGGQGADLDFAKALKIANAAEFVDQLPLGLETRLGENGMRLSGGQRQRLSLARAVLRSPALLVLDEPTNHLGAAEVKLFIERFRAAYSAASVVVISHDAEILEAADRLYIAESGTLRAIRP